MAYYESTFPTDWRKNMAVACKYKETGNEHYKKAQYSAAIGQYHRALIYIKAITAAQKPLGGAAGLSGAMPPAIHLPEEVQIQLNKLYADCQSNIAASMLQTEKPTYSRVLECCNEAIKLCPDNAKTHYRRGVALYYLREFDEAILALQKAAKIQSKIDANISRYLDLCNQGKVKERDEARRRCQAMFSAPSET